MYLCRYSHFDSFNKFSFPLVSNLFFFYFAIHSFGIALFSPGLILHRSFDLLSPNINDFSLGSIVHSALTSKFHTFHHTHIHNVISLSFGIHHRPNFCLMMTNQILLKRFPNKKTKNKNDASNLEIHGTKIRNSRDKFNVQM